jgi:phage protein U
MKDTDRAIQQNFAVACVDQPQTTFFGAGCSRRLARSISLTRQSIDSKAGNLN